MGKQIGLSQNSHLDTVSHLLSLWYVVPPLLVDRDRVEEVLVQVAVRIIDRRSISSASW